MPIPAWGGKKRKYLTRTEFAEFCHASPGDVANALNLGHIRSVRQRGKEKINVETEAPEFVKHCRKAWVADLPPASVEAVPHAPATDASMSLGEIERQRELTRLKLDRIKLAEQQGRLIPAEPVGKNYAAMGALIKKAVLGIADRLAPLLAGESDQHACGKILDTECRQILENLANQFEKYPAPDAGTPEPTPESEPKNESK